MANNRRKVFLSCTFIVVVLAIGLIAVRWNIQYQKDLLLHRLISAVQSESKVRAKLLSNKDLYQEETDYVDMGSYSGLILSLLTPMEQAPIISTNYPHICQLQITNGNSATVTIDVVWMGTGLLLVAMDGQCFRRTGNYCSLGNDMYVDEPATICGLIKSLIESNQEECSSYAKRLRGSACQ